MPLTVGCSGVDHFGRRAVAAQAQALAGDVRFVGEAGWSAQQPGDVVHRQGGVRVVPDGGAGERAIDEPDRSVLVGSDFRLAVGDESDQFGGVEGVVVGFGVAGGEHRDEDRGVSGADPGAMPVSVGVAFGDGDGERVDAAGCGQPVIGVYVKSPVIGSTDTVPFAGPAITRISSGSCSASAVMIVPVTTRSRSGWW